MKFVEIAGTEQEALTGQFASVEELRQSFAKDFATSASFSIPVKGSAYIW
jgi:hypothetical protein